jgi:hypothetical protein
MKTSLILIIPLFFVFTLSCNKDDALKPITGDCGSGDVLKKAKNRVGTVLANPADSTYIISYHEPGTYDSVDFGYVCNLPDNMKEAGLKVEFSGEYRKHPLPGAFGGSTNYYLKLTEISRK